MDKLKEWIGYRVEVHSTYGLPHAGTLSDLRMDQHANGLWLLLDDKALFNWQYVTAVWRME